MDEELTSKGIDPEDINILKAEIAKGQDKFYKTEATNTPP
jgi:hypothetical protein